ncbi:hypothetical protein E4P39_12950 [Blastococcus sp. CT_GayMR19]|uniref:hypothetical protein n=1 Tax=Blastococcus sp. CT_GayMR19 TaxID=2559608 RepID=UPI001073EACF|nr:hypothetical protein [Blastococcus sp. CT_GayMR19]TFV74392.1 hypothetical protein E4P39_12950 [Blastococcus sp. CT_GayMR19]
MTGGWHKARQEALESVTLLADLLADQSTDEHRLTRGYLETKRALAAAFSELGAEKYSGDERMMAAKAAIEVVMREAYPRLSSRYASVRGFGRIHERILNLLSERIGTDVGGDELRLLAGDAVHTERRARELRDLGFNLVTRDGGAGTVYRLTDARQDVLSAAARLVARNIREDKSLSEADRRELLLGLEG